MFPRLRAHWPEYLSEMVCLATFMISAAAFTTLLRHPQSPAWLGSLDGIAVRWPMGLAMALTAIAIIYSPLGRRSGAHMNPAITLTFLRLGKIARADAAAYIVAQLAGGVLGIVAATWLLANLPADPSVNYVATVPGPSGAAIAFAAELLISFGMMTAVLVVSNHARFNRWTGVCAGLLVFTYITLEAPLSGMSMNPARSLGPAVFARTLESMWIYIAAPIAGMFLAAEVYVRRHGLSRVFCAKLDHPAHVRCIFNCHFPEVSR